MSISTYPIFLNSIKKLKTIFFQNTFSPTYKNQNSPYQINTKYSSFQEKMGQNLPIIAKKFWKIVRVVYFMLRKGISKAKLLADLNIMMKRGKIAGKAAVHNLVFHHHHHSAAADTAEPQLSYPVPLNEYEFSCSKTPTFRLPFNLNKRKHSQSPQTQPSDADLFAAAMEIVGGGGVASPALPGFRRTPVVRQLRITDSPFPLKDVEADDHVDEAAEKFIMKFYKDLRRQNA